MPLSSTEWRWAFTGLALAAGCLVFLRATIFQKRSRRIKAKEEEEEEAAPAQAAGAEGTAREEPMRSSMAPSQPSRQAQPSRPPVTDLPRDVIVAAFDLLGAQDLAASGVASRLLFLLVTEVQRRPTLVTEVGTPSEVLKALGGRLMATPTMGLVFGTSALGDDVLGLLSRRLPVGCDVVGAVSGELQALVPACAADAEGRRAAGRGATVLRSERSSDRVALMLGSFPEAVTHAFHMPVEKCVEISNAAGDAAASALLQRHGLPAGEEWKTILVLVSAGSLYSHGSARVNLERILKAFQHGRPGTAIIGGIAPSQLLILSRGRARLESGGVVGLALKGDVPLTALVSRGCTPLSPPLRVRGARVEAAAEGSLAVGGPSLHIPELVTEAGESVQPVSAAVAAQHKTQGGGVFAGLRPSASGGGYVLSQLSPSSFDRSAGAMILDLESSLVPPLESPGRADDYEVRFFALDADECRKDVERLLGYVRQESDARGEQTLGAVLFTCGGRGARFFGDNFVDARRFQACHPGVPLVGFWAGGEIGPQALAEATPAQATCVGRVALQGFTAVFGIFRAPAAAPKTMLLELEDERVPVEVGRVFADLACLARGRGNAAFRDNEAAEAAAHYSRALALLTALPPGTGGAAAAPTERATLLSNRSAARLKLPGKEESGALARQDAEEALVLDPSNAKAHYRRAMALLNMNQPGEAAAGLRAAVASIPEAAAAAPLRELLARAERRVAEPADRRASSG